MHSIAIDDELAAEFAAIARDAGCELLHVESKGSSLRVFLDHPDGVTLEHCQSVSRQISAWLDVRDGESSEGSNGAGGRYVLEVSSPGLDRQLYRPEDYDRFAGKLVRVTFAGDGGKRTVVGRLGEGRFADGTEVHVDADGEPMRIRLDDIEVARLEIEL